MFLTRNSAARLIRYKKTIFALFELGMLLSSGKSSLID